MIYRTKSCQTLWHDHGTTALPKAVNLWQAFAQYYMENLWQFVRFSKEFEELKSLSNPICPSRPKIFQL